MPNRRIFPDPGERVHVELPFSEVCMHLRIAGRILPVEWLGNGTVQVYDGDDRKLSFPILASEAGFHFNSQVGGWECWGIYATNAPELPRRCRHCNTELNDDGTDYSGSRFCPDSSAEIHEFPTD